MYLMPNRGTYRRLLKCLIVSLAFPSADVHAQIRFSSIDDFASDLAAVPCASEERRDAAVGLFEKAGAARNSISRVSSRGAENLVVRMPGSSFETVVVGAHYDKASSGCGAIDNWTGVVAIAHMYRTLTVARLNKTLVFVAFDQEEKGLVGSKAMVDAIPKESRRQYCAMINIDSLGRSAPQVLDNASSPKLLKLGSELADAMNIPFTHAVDRRGDADSTSFVRSGIPALTIHGLSFDWAKILHTNEDQPSKVNAGSVYLGYRLALAVLARVDDAPCMAFR